MFSLQANKNERIYHLLAHFVKHLPQHLDDLEIIITKSKWDRNVKISLFTEDEHRLIFERFITFYDEKDFHLVLRLENFSKNEIEILGKEENLEKILFDLVMIDGIGTG